MGNEIVSASNTRLASFEDSWANPESAYKMCQYLSKSGDMVPTKFQNKPEAIFAAAAMAVSLGVPTMMFLQHAYVVNGRVGIDAQTTIAIANAAKIFEGPILCAFSGLRMTPNWTCTAFATIKGTAQIVKYTLPWTTVSGEGWTKNTKWQTMPEHMMELRAKTYLIRLNFPDVIMGLTTREEIEDGGQPIEATVVSGEDLLAKLTAPKEPQPAAIEVVDAEVIAEPDPTGGHHE